jgi:hypothetical protein
LDELYQTKLVPLHGAKAEGLLSKMKTFECFLGINISYKVFAITERLATELRCKHTTSIASRANAMTAIATLKQMRSAKKFDQMWLQINDRANKHAITSYCQQYYQRSVGHLGE